MDDIQKKLNRIDLIRKGKIVELNFEVLQSLKKHFKNLGENTAIGILEENTKTVFMIFVEGDHYENFKYKEHGISFPSESMHHPQLNFIIADLNRFKNFSFDNSDFIEQLQTCSKMGLFKGKPKFKWILMEGCPLIIQHDYIVHFNDNNIFDYTIDFGWWMNKEGIENTETVMKLFIE